MKYGLQTLRVVIFLVLVLLSKNAIAQCPGLPTILSLGSNKDPNQLCSPVTAELEYNVRFASNLLAGNTCDIYFFWGDGTATVASLAPGTTTYTVTRTKAYPLNSDCEYEVQMILRYNGIYCSQSTQTQKIPAWRTDAFNGGNIQLISPTTGTEIHEVCEGVDVDVVFDDESVFNCNANYNPLPNPPNTLVETPNTEVRWQQIVYNTPLGGTKIPNVSVNGVPVTGPGGADVIANYQDTRGVFEMLPPVVINDPRRRATLPITAPGGFGPGFPTVGNEFEITIRYWNYCNPYSNNGPGFPPVNGDLVNGDNAPIERTAIIRIIDAPDAPVVPDRDVCSTESDVLTVSAPLGAGFIYRWWNDPVLRLPANELTTGTTFNPSNAQAPVGQRTHFWVTVESTAAGTCRSDATEVRLIKRPALTSPSPISGPTNLCPNSTYTFSVGTSPTDIVITDPTTDPDVNLVTEYNWTVPGSWTINSGNGTNTINITTGGVASGNVTVTRQYDAASSNGTFCVPTATSLPVAVRGRPTVGISPDPAEICEGSTIQLNGNPTLPGTAAGFSPTISSHNWGGATAILDASNIQQPNVLTTASPGNYGLSYSVTADFGGGVFCTSTTDNSTADISASPTPATVGGDQDLCFSVGDPLISNPLGGSNPAPGTGVWTKVSGPGGAMIFTPDASTPNATATAPTNGVFVLRWTVTNGTCVSSGDVTVDYGTDPGPQDAGTDNTFCGLTGSLNAVAPTVGTIAWSQFSGPGTTTFAPVAPTIPNPGITVTVPGTYVYRMTVTSGTCAIQTNDVQIIFRDPATSSPAADFTSCVDPAVLAAINLTGTVGGGATGGRWERVSGTGTIGSSGTNVGNNILGVNVNDTYTPTAADFAAGSFQVRLVATGALAPCPEVSVTRTITIDRRPTAVEAGAAQPLVCADPISGLGSTTLTATAVDNGGVGTWSGPGGVSFSDVNSPTATVFDLPVGLTTLTWTVNSALAASPGGCGAQVDQVDITVNVLPAAIDPAPNNLCEIVEGSGVALGADLTQYNDGVTGIIGSVNRTIEWYDQLPRNAGNLIATPASFDVSNGQILYTRVYNATTNCFRDGEVTFTINPLPAAVDQAYEFCEEFPAGSDQVQNIDLTAAAMIDPVTGIVGSTNRTVVWFNTLADATGNINPIPNPTTYDVLSGTETVFARVTNTVTTCVNVAEVDLVVKPRPADPTIVGSENQCLNGFDLYSVTPVAGVTYIWDVDDNPATEFDVIAGGAPTDFLVVLSFPNVYSGNVRLTLDRDGCVSNQVTKPVTVQATPPPVTISASKDPVCENDGGIVFTATALPLTDYTWEIPVVGGATGSSIIGGQGSNIATVNIGTISGNINVTPQTQGGSCAGAPATFFIDVRERPELDNYAITPVCSDQAIGITLQEAAGSPVPTSYQITNVTVAPGLNPSSRPLATGPANLIFNDSYTNVGNGNTPLDVRYTIVPISVEGCEGSPKDIIVRIRPEPIINPNLDRTVCSREAANIVLQVASNSAPADQFEITSIENLGGLVALGGNPVTGTGFLANEIADDVWENTTGVTATIRYFIRPVNTTTGCIGDPPYPVLLIVHPEPQITSPTTEVICSGDTPTIMLTSSIPGSSFEWSVKSISGLIVGGGSGTGNTINNVLTNNDVVPGSITYEVIATGPGGASGTCVSQPVDVTIDVNPAPVSNNVDQIVCSDEAGGTTFVEDLQALEATINGGAVTFTWYEDLALTQQIIAPQLNAWPLANGIPVYVVIDNGQCQKVQPVTYTVDPTPSVTASITSNFNGFNVSCAGSSNGQITADPAAQGSPNYLYSIDGGTSFFTSRVFNGLSALGNPYVITVRDSRGCVAQSAPMTITEPPVLTATNAITSDHNGQHVSCPGATDGEITVTPVGGVAPYTYQILELPSNVTGNATGVYTGLRAGTYTVFVRDANNICTVTTNTVTLVDPPLIVATATLTSPVSCNGVSDGEISVSAVGGTLINPDYTYTLNTAPNPSNNTGDFTGLAAGPYSVTVEDDNGCSQVSNIVIVTQPSVLTAFASVTSNYNGSKISCPGANDGIITVTPNGGNGGYTFVLVEDNANTSGDATGVYTGLAPGNYTVTVSDAENCSVTTVAVSISDPQPITPAFSITSPIVCNGDANGQITISGNGGTGALTYTRISGPGSPEANATGVFSGLAQGTYDFTVSDLNLCSAPIQVTLNEPTLVTATATVTSDYFGSETSCTTTSDGVITVTANGGTGAYQYVFDQTPANTSGETSGVFIGIPAGTGYTFTVEDANGCPVTTAPIDIVAPTVVTVTSASVTSNYNGQDISCTGAEDAEITIEVTGGTTTVAGPTGYTYRLDQEPLNTTGNSTGVYTGVGIGSYTVTVRDVNNCFVVTVPIVVDPYPAITVPASVTSNFNGRQISCNGEDDGEIEVIPAGGVAPFTFVLDPPLNASGLNSGLFTGLIAGTYTITATDANGCPRTTSPITISEPAVLAASTSITSNYNGQQISCFGASDGVIQTSVSGGTTAYAFVLNEIGGNVTGAANGIFTGVPAGPSYTITITDVNGCNTTTNPIAITEPLALAISGGVSSNYNGEDISCNGANDAIITVTFTPGTGTGTPTFAFDPPNGNTTGLFSGVFTGVTPNAGYTIIATDVNGCTTPTALIPVTEPLALGGVSDATSEFNGFDISCFNLTDGQITVTPSGGTGDPLADFTYLLLEASSNTSGETDGVFDGLRAGTYRARITDQNGCTFITPVIPVTQPTDISIAIDITSNYGVTGADLSCADATDGEISVRATISGGTGLDGGGAGSGIIDYTYELDQDPGNVDVGDNGVFTGLDNALYTVTATDANGCTKQSLPVVLIDPLPLFGGIVGLDKSICLGDDPTAFTELAAVFGGTGGYAYQWQDSIEGGIFTNIAGADAATFDPPVSVVEEKRFYRRLVSSGSGVGCPTLPTNEVSVTVNPLPTVALAPSKTPVCEGDFFLLEFTFTGQAPFYFDYDDGTNFTDDRLGAANTPVPVLNYANTTTFTVTEVRDFNGCVAPVLPAPLTVPVIKINPNFAILNPAPQCSGGVFNFEFTVDPDVEYTWFWGDGQSEVIPPNSLAPGTQGINHTYLSLSSSGTSSFPVILTAVNSVEGCGPKQTNAQVQIFPVVIENISPGDTIICSGQSVKFTNLTQGANTHLWRYRVKGSADPFTDLSDVSPTIVFNNTTATDPLLYEVLYTGSNTNSCIDEEEFDVVVYRGLPADFTFTPPAPEYTGGQTTITFTNISNPVDDAIFRYEWDFGSNSTPQTLVGGGPVIDVDYSSPGFKDVVLRVTNILAEADGEICVTTRSRTVEIQVPDFSASFNVTPMALCAPITLTTENTSGAADEFLWVVRRVSPPNDTIAFSSLLEPVFTIAEPGEYAIILTASLDALGLEETAVVTGIKVYESPVALFIARPEIGFTDTEISFFNDSYSPSDPVTKAVYPMDYYWDFDDNATSGLRDPSYKFETEGLYTVELKVENVHPDGIVCSDSTTRTVTIRAGSSTKVPNAFTPDPSGPNDGRVYEDRGKFNDVFLPFTQGVVDGGFIMQVFDRWGNLVFESRNKEVGWNGYDRNNNLLPAGVYVYKLSLEFADGRRTTQIGDITMIR